MAKVFREKRRNSDKRREKSRDAARIRREKESDVFQELTDMIPLQNTQLEGLDKTSIMRLCVSYLKIRQLIGAGDEYDSAYQDNVTDKLIEKSLDGFVMFLSSDGDIVYVSEGCSKHLGLSYVDIMGCSLFDYTNPCDYDEIQEILHKKQSEQRENEHETFFLRMKCTLTSRGKSVNLKSASYKVLRCSGHMIKPSHLSDSKEEENTSSVLALIASPIPHPSNIEVPLDCDTFLTRHNMDMSFTYCDDRIQDLTGFTPDELNGRSFYDYHHALDSAEIEKNYKTLFSKGQTMTGAYRLLAKHGGYIWVSSQCTVIKNSRTQKAQCVVCVHYVLSGVENNKLILAEVQQSRSSTNNCLVTIDPNTYNANASLDSSPFTAFLPDEDLTHLAPIAGDSCIPLEPPSLFGSSPDLTSIYSNEMLPDKSIDRHDPPMSLTDSLIFSTLDQNESLTPSPVSMEMLDQRCNQTGRGIYVDDNLNNCDLEMRAPFIPMDCDDFNLFEFNSQTELPNTSNTPCDRNVWSEGHPVSSTLSCLTALTVEPDSTTSFTPHVSPVPSPTLSPAQFNKGNKSCPLLQQQLTSPTNPSANYTRTTVSPRKAPIMHPETGLGQGLMTTINTGQHSPSSHVSTSQGSVIVGSPPLCIDTSGHQVMSATCMSVPSPQSPRNQTIESCKSPSSHFVCDQMDFRHDLLKRKHDAGLTYQQGPLAKSRKFGIEEEMKLKGSQLAHLLGYTNKQMPNSDLSEPQTTKDRKTVLMNLLTRGEDSNGYTVIQKPLKHDHNGQTKPTSHGKRLPVITTFDAEVNAPAENRKLLQGRDLLDALDFNMPMPDSTTFAI